MDKNEILKQFLKTEKFKKVAEERGLSLSDFENLKIDSNVDNPFVKALQEIAKNSDIANEKTLNENVKRVLLNV